MKKRTLSTVWIRAISTGVFAAALFAVVLLTLVMPTQAKAVKETCDVHEWGEWQVRQQPTCTADGEEYRKCNNCVRNESRVIPATGHRWGEWQIVTEPTCTAQGEKMRSCTVCPTASERESIPALGHNMVTVATHPATCTSRAYTELKCTRCGYTDTESSGDYAEHVMGEWEITTQPTCTTEGRRDRSCTVCGKAPEKESIPALGHNMVTVATHPATCMNRGYTELKCTRCDYTDTNEGSYGSHVMGEWQTTTQPTCTAAGEKRRTCTVCGKAPEKESIPALGHDMVAGETVTGTCIREGYTSKKCSRCGYEEKTSTGYGAHVWGEWEITIPATCTTEGERRHMCVVCQVAGETLEYPALGHNMVAGETVTGTCIREGYTSKKCSRCGHEEKTSTGYGAHVMGEWQTTTQPTCTGTGEKQRNCTVCGKVPEKETIPANGHRWGAWYVKTPAEIGKDGLEERDCQVCGRAETRPIPALADDDPTDADHTITITDTAYVGEYYEYVMVFKDLFPNASSTKLISFENAPFGGMHHSNSPRTYHRFYGTPLNTGTLTVKDQIDVDNEIYTVVFILSILERNAETSMDGGTITITDTAYVGEYYEYTIIFKDLFPNASRTELISFEDSAFAGINHGNDILHFHQFYGTPEYVTVRTTKDIVKVDNETYTILFIINILERDAESTADTEPKLVMSKVAPDGYPVHMSKKYTNFNLFSAAYVDVEWLVTNLSNEPIMIKFVNESYSWDNGVHATSFEKIKTLLPGESCTQTDLYYPDSLHIIQNPWNLIENGGEYSTWSSWSATGVTESGEEVTSNTITFNWPVILDEDPEDPSNDPTIDPEDPTHDPEDPNDPQNMAASLVMVKAEASAPANGQHYAAGEEITYSITYQNVSDKPISNIHIYDALAGLSKIVSADSLAPGESKSCSFRYRVTAANVNVQGYVANTAFAFYWDGRLTRRAISNRVVVVLNPDIVPPGILDPENPDDPDDPDNIIGLVPTITIGDPDNPFDPEHPEDYEGPFGLPGMQGEDHCELIVKNHVPGATDYDQHYCAAHQSTRTAVQAMTNAASTPAVSLSAWTYARTLWQNDCNVLLEKLYSCANDPAKAIIMEEHIGFETMVAMRGAALNVLYPDQPEKVAEEIAKLYEDRCIELCYMLHTLPKAKPVEAAGADMVTMFGDSAICRTEITGDTGADVSCTETLCSQHAMTDMMTGFVLNGMDDPAAAMKQVGLLWRSELRTEMDLIRGAQTEENAAILTYDLGTTRIWLEAREALLHLLYPKQEAAVTNIINDTVKQRVTTLCEEANK